MNGFALGITCLVWTIIILPVMGGITQRLKLERLNFQERWIPAGFGFLIVLSAVPVYLALLVSPLRSNRLVFFLITLLGFGAIGLIDDVYGDREAGGFRGHLGLLKQGRVSTGLIKAVIGGLLGLLLGLLVAEFGVWQGLLNGLLISLAANTLNLLDLRPGRAVTCFWIGLAGFAVSRIGNLPAWKSVLIPVAIPAAVLSWLDRTACVMMGDSGSNVLGAVLGLVFAYELDVPSKIVLVLLMIVVHVYSEKYSISKLIESNRLLRRMDRLLGVR
jgi:UDP-N-acetylmuramyl pentapeptide phosphotransferase/UDP-N-acetylglucosamine-1-phosphate transferase